ncbi:MAG: hypothetical protein GC182_08605 [Rhodopseudomonas sp.]|nr:hypothetical protein [Rhodopseudomonas sp.]
MYQTPDTVSGDLLENGLWLSISALAKRKGVKKQTISERVARLETDGLLGTKPGPGRSKLVNIAEYDRAVGQVGDPAKEAGAATKSGGGDSESRDPTYRDAKATDAFYAGELKRLEYEERTGKLVLAAEVSAAQDEFGRKIAADLDRILLCTGELAAAVGKDGEQGARRVLKQAIFDVRKRIASDMRAVANEVTGSPVAEAS